MSEPLLELVIDSPSVARVRLAGGAWEPVRSFRVATWTDDGFYVLHHAPRIPTPAPAVITTAPSVTNGDAGSRAPGGTAAEGGVVEDLTARADER